MEKNESNNQENVMGNQEPITGNPVPMMDQPQKKSNKGLIIGVIAVVAIVLVGGGIFVATRKSPLAMVNEGFEKTMASVRPGIGEYLGSKELMKFTDAGVYEQTFKLSLDEVISADEYTDVSMFSGIEIGTDSALDYTNKKMDSNLSISYGGTKLVDANIYAYDNTVAVSAADYFEGYLESGTSSFGADFNKSALASLTQMQLSGSESLILFPDKGEEVTTEETTEVFNFVENIKKSASGQDADVLVEKTKGKEEIEVGGVSQSCDEYSMMVPKAMIQEALKTYIEYIKNMVSYEQEVVKDIITEFEGIECTDTTVYLYLDNEGRVVKFKFDTEYLMNEQKLNAVFDIVANGKEYLWDDFKASISYLWSEDMSTMDLLWEKSTTADGTSTISNHKLTLEDGVDTILIDGALMFNTDNGELSINGEIKPDDGELNDVALEFKGKFSDVNKGNGYTLDISDMVVSVGGGDYSASFSGLYRLAPLAREVKAPEGSARNILTMSEDDLSAFVMEVMMNLETSPIGQLMSSLYY